MIYINLCVIDCMTPCRWDFYWWTPSCLRCGIGVPSNPYSSLHGVSKIHEKVSHAESISGQNVLLPSVCLCRMRTCCSLPGLAE